MIEAIHFFSMFINQSPSLSVLKIDSESILQIEYHKVSTTVADYHVMAIAYICAVTKRKIGGPELPIHVTGKLLLNTRTLPSADSLESSDIRGPTHPGLSICLKEPAILRASWGELSYKTRILRTRTSSNKTGLLYFLWEAAWSLTYWVPQSTVSSHQSLYDKFTQPTIRGY